MTTTSTARTVATSLAEVARWRAEEDASAATERAEVEQEAKNLQRAIQNLQNQLDELIRFAAELDAKRSNLDARQHERARAGLLEALREQAKAVSQRDQEVARAAKAQEAAFEERLRKPDLAATVEEYRQFKTSVEPTLGALPESYRGVILEHHETVANRLRTAIAELESSAPSLAKDDVVAEVVWAVDAPDGEPEMLVCILPTSDRAYQEWASREDGPQLWLAARTAQAFYEAAVACGFETAHANAGGYEGLLVFECDVAGAGASFVDAFEERLGAILAQAPEFGHGRLAVAQVRVEMDVLLPPQDEEEGDAG
jgi:hypothetical protein